VTRHGAEGEESNVAAVAACGPSGRWELVRALAGLLQPPGPATDRLAALLELPAVDRVAHTEVFVLALPPHAGVWLGPAGQLGDEGADRTAGVWRALGLRPPADADHLGAVLLLYAELGDAAERSLRPATRERLDHVRTQLLWEHLWSWVPVYADAVDRLASQIAHAAPVAAWARLLSAALTREAGTCPPPVALPLALRSAPGIAGGDDLLDALVAPARCGVPLTHADLGQLAGSTGLGLRRGERRFALRALLDQDRPVVLAALADHARAWRDRHHARRRLHPGDPAGWWAARAGATARHLDQLR
jgi:hypothetical protein